MQVEVSGMAAERLRLLVERGGFTDESQAVEAAIETLWLESEASDELERLVREALDDVDAGRITPLTRDLATEISRNGRANLAASENALH